MITSKTTLAEITPQIVEDLLKNDADEDIYFDFKEGLENSSPKSVHGIRKAIASFANTFGGLLFFGILDKKNRDKKWGLDRIVGLMDTTELGPRITQKYLGRDLCLPVVSFEGPRILRVQDKDIAVIGIPRSSNAPHAIKEAADRTLEFWTRGSGTAQPMDYAHLLSEIDRNRELRGWLLALSQDLDTLIHQTKETEIQGNQGGTSPLPNAYSSVVISNTGDILRVLAEDTEFVQRFLRLRDSLHQANDRRVEGIAMATKVMIRSEDEDRMNKLNLQLGAMAQTIRARATSVREHLTATYPVVREKSADNASP